MRTWTIRHVPGSNPSTFLIETSESAIPARSTPVPSASSFPVPGRPDSFLLDELRWYLERFRDYPFPPETEHAEQVLRALRSWGGAAFAALFGDERGTGLFFEASPERQAALRLRIESDDPRVLSWPWEVLGNSETGPLGAAAWIERALATVGPLSQSPPILPSDPLNVLLITSRPGDNDVAYRSVSRPIVDLAAELPLRVHVLRPPTLQTLEKHLRERPHKYQILHFDGHGDTALLSRHRVEGRLFFEDDAGNGHPVLGKELAEVLRQNPVPLLVLNACRSARFDERMHDPLASVAASLLQAGTGTVLAMAYELNVQGARQLLPAFYQTLCETGDAGAALWAGRRCMLEQTERIGPWGRFSLQDWIVPVLYRHPDASSGFPLAARQHKATSRRRALRTRPIGRDSTVLKAERLLRRPPSALVVHGLAGVGKTSFARSLCEWLTETEGVERILWLDSRETRDAGTILDRLLEIGPEPVSDAVDPIRRQVEDLVLFLRERRLLLVLDGLEGLLAEEDRDLLLNLLRTFHGGSTKVMITSRSDLEWLSEERLTLPLGGLVGEERWELLERIAVERMPTADRSQPRLVQWIDLISGHPQTMWALLPKLEDRSAEVFFQDFRSGAALDETTEDGAELLAPVRFLEENSGEPLASLRILLAFHERFLHAELFVEMTRVSGALRSRSEIEAFLQSLISAGLLRDCGAESFEIHPALPGFLRTRVLPCVSAQARAAWARAFTSVMGGFAYELALRPFHRQDRASERYQANFLSALEEAQHLGAMEDQIAILQWMATFAHYNRLYDQAIGLFERLLELFRSTNELANVSTTLHRLGMVAQDRGDFERAETWYLDSLQMDEKLGDEVGAARTGHQLGMLAQEQQDPEKARDRFQRALEAFKRHHLNSDAAASCHQLGILAQERGNLTEAAEWYDRGRVLVESAEDEHILARFEHQLAVVALLRGELPQARLWCRRSLARKLRLRDEPAIASGYHQLGLIAQEERDLDEAEKYFQRSLHTSERLERKLVIANTYHHLGVNAQLRGDLAGARTWFYRALELSQGPDDVELANTHHHLGMVAQDLDEQEEAEKEYRTALRLIEKKGNEREKIPTLFSLGQLLAERGSLDESGWWLAESLRVAEKVGDEIGESRALHQLGLLAQLRRDHTAAEQFYNASLNLSQKLGLDNFSAATLTQISAMVLDQGKDEESFHLLLKAFTCLQRSGDAALIRSLKDWLAGFYDELEEENRERFWALLKEEGLREWLPFATQEP